MPQDPEMQSKPFDPLRTNFQYTKIYISTKYYSSSTSRKKMAHISFRDINVTTGKTFNLFKDVADSLNPWIQIHFAYNSTTVQDSNHHKVDKRQNIYAPPYKISWTYKQHKMSSCFP